MQANVENPTLKYDNLVVSSRGLAGTDGKKIVLFVPPAEVDHIILKFGRADHRPIASLSIGIVFSLIGFYGLIELFLAPRGLRYEMGMVFFGVVGGSIIFDSLKKRYFLEVHKSNDVCRLIFSKKACKHRYFCGL